MLYTLALTKINATVVSSIDSFVPTWGETSSSVYTDIPENLPEGSYVIQLQLYSEDELVGNTSLDYIKG